MNRIAIWPASTRRSKPAPAGSLPRSIIRFCLLAGLGISSLRAADEGQRSVTAETLVAADAASAKTEGRRPWRYLLYLPAGYESGDEDWPLIFYLHGRSLRGDNLSEVKRYGLPARLERRRDVPFVVVSPQLPSGSWPTKPVLALLDEVMAKYRVDSDRVYLTGVSLGGGGAWQVAAADAGRFAAFAPICGSAHSSLAPRVANLPIWAFHGAKDEVTPLQDVQALIDAVQARGGRAWLSIDPEGTHGSVITPAYGEEELYRWFLRNRRGQAAAAVAPFAPFARTDGPEGRGEVAPSGETPPERKPGSSPKVPGAQVNHVVRKGDSLWKLGREYGVPVEELKRINHLETDLIRVGQVLILPK